MKVLIIEDESLAAKAMERMLLEIQPDAEILGSVQSITSSVEWIRNNKTPDLILSDIRLLDGLSFEIFEQVKTEAPVIFTTAYDQYAIRAFEVNSIDYLLKPIEKEKLMVALEKLQTRAKASTTVNYRGIIEFLNTQKVGYKSRFMVRLGQKIVAVPSEKIAYFYSENKLTFMLTKDGKRYPTDQTLDELTDLLDPQTFFRVNRQFIVTFDAITEIHPYFKGRIKLTLLPLTQKEVVISSERSPAFKKWIDQ